jgi:Malectin domain/Kelch motif
MPAAGPRRPGSPLRARGRARLRVGLTALAVLAAALVPVAVPRGVPQAVAAAGELHVDFGPPGSPASGYVRDAGEAFTAARGSGWQTSTGAPLALEGNGRDRGVLSDDRLDTFLHMQLKPGSAGVTTTGRYEAVVPNGTYALTVGVGDPGYADSRHVVRAEGAVVVDLVPTATTRTRVATATVTVSDGRLTVDAVGGTNTKIGFLDLVPTTPSPTPSPIRINAGGPAVTTGGVAWEADRYAVGGKAFANPNVTAIAGTTDDVLYRDERSATQSLGGFRYAIPVPASVTYDVRLHFAELWFGATGGGPAGTGKRVFSANIEGGAVELPSFDVYAEVGAMTAAVRTFRTTVTDGTVDVSFTATADQPTVAAIEVLPVAGTGTPGPDTPGPGTPATVAWPTSWTRGTSSPTACFEATATTVGDTIYRFGGFDASFDVIRTYSSYRPATDTWTTLGTLPAGMAESHVAVANDGRYVYLAGGFGGDIDTSRAPTQWISDAVMRYDTVGRTWSRIATLPQPRGAGTLDLVDGKLHYISGNPADRVTNVADHFVLDLSTGRWTTAAPIPDAKDHLSSVVLDGRIYTMGGEHGHDERHLQRATVHVYDPATDAWTRLADLPQAKSHIEAGTFVHGSRIVMAGGQVDNFQPTDGVVAYDPATDAWSVLPPLPVKRQGAIVQRVGDEVVLALGGVQTNQPQSGVWRARLP